MDDISVTVDEKLGEVPFDPFASQYPWGIFFEILIQGMGIVAVHLDFCEHGEGDFVVESAKVFDL